MRLALLASRSQRPDHLLSRRRVVRNHVWRWRSVGDIRLGDDGINP